MPKDMDMSDVPMNYRPAMQYTGRMRDLLYSPGYEGLQQDLVKMERDKLARQLQVENSPEARSLFGLREQERIHQQALQDEAKRQALLRQKQLSDLSALASQANSQRIVQTGGIYTPAKFATMNPFSRSRGMDNWNNSVW